MPWSHRALRVASSLAHQLPRSNSRDDDHRRLQLLTPREREVMIAVSRGLSNAEVAEVLVLSEATVKTHVGRILAKLDLRDRVQIVVFAYDQGLVTPAP
jgi:DNA-binding NarL/FixJ family response regulator